MEVRVQRPARALQHGDAGASPRHAARASAERVHAEQDARVHPQHRAAQPVIPRQLVAQPIRHRQHPLPHRHPRQQRVHQMGGPLRHPPATTAQTPPAPFTRNGTRCSRPRTETAPRRPRTRRTSGTPGTRARRTAAGRLRRQPPPPRPGRPPGVRRRPGGARCARRLAGDTRARHTPCLWVARPPPPCPCPKMDTPAQAPTEAAALYIGYVENRHSEQRIFTCNRAPRAARLRGGHVGWASAHPVTHGSTD
jgi:hypothetical protein